mmetsp:Transcript_28369/g.79758  ORF Transcript_28369/g.79758 Transcript_28369/m.79758 type:complete len:171 (-) Transcript_28369:388-900(-)
MIMIATPMIPTTATTSSPSASAAPTSTTTKTAPIAPTQPIPIQHYPHYFQDSENSRADAFLADQRDTVMYLRMIDGITQSLMESSSSKTKYENHQRMLDRLHQIRHSSSSASAPASTAKFYSGNSGIGPMPLYHHGGVIVGDDDGEETDSASTCSYYDEDEEEDIFELEI